MDLRHKRERVRCRQGGDDRKIIEEKQGGDETDLNGCGSGGGRYGCDPNGHTGGVRVSYYNVGHWPALGLWCSTLDVTQSVDIVPGLDVPKGTWPWVEEWRSRPTRTGGEAPPPDASVDETTPRQQRDDQRLTGLHQI